MTTILGISYRYAPTAETRIDHLAGIALLRDWVGPLTLLNSPGWTSAIQGIQAEASRTLGIPLLSSSAPHEAEWALFVQARKDIDDVDRKYRYIVAIDPAGPSFLRCDDARALRAGVGQSRRILQRIIEREI